MKLYLIRHGATKGNKEHRYVGTTDEGLLYEAQKELEERRERFFREPEGKSLLLPDSLYVSPLKRCRQTAALLYPGREQIVIGDFRECDFGKFEYQNYQELNGDPDYQRFIDTRGESGFPGGETLQDFRERCVRAFLGLLKEELAREEEDKKRASGKGGAGGTGDGERRCVLSVHGGTIMALLEHYARPRRDYYDWQTKNGEGFQASVFREKDGYYLGDVKRLWES